MAIRKKNFEVEVPLINSSFSVPAIAIKDLHDKTLKIDTTRILHGKSIELIVSVKVEDNKATGIPKKMTLMPFYIRRMIRNNISYIEDSFICSATDAKFRIKPVMITRKAVHRSVRKALSQKAREEIESFCKDKTLDEVFSEVLSGNFQKELSLKLKKIYPLSLCEIRMLIPEKKA